MAKSVLTVSLSIPDEDGDALAERIGISQTTPDNHRVFPALADLFRRGTTLKPVQCSLAVDEYTASGQFAGGPVTVVVTPGTHGSIADNDFTYIGGYKWIWKTSASAANEVTIGANQAAACTNLAAKATTALGAAGALYGILTSATATATTVTFVFASPGALGEFMVNYDQSGGVTFDVTDLKPVTTRTRKSGQKVLT